MPWIYYIYCALNYRVDNVSRVLFTFSLAFTFAFAFALALIRPFLAAVLGFLIGSGGGMRVKMVGKMVGKSGSAEGLWRGGNRNEIPWQTMDQLRSLSFTAIAIGTTQHDMDETWSETREKFQRKIATTTTEEGGRPGKSKGKTENQKTKRRPRSFARAWSKFWCEIKIGIKSTMRPETDRRKRQPEQSRAERDRERGGAWGLSAKWFMAVCMPPPLCLSFSLSLSLSLCKLFSRIRQNDEVFIRVPLELRLNYGPASALSWSVLSSALCSCSILTQI